MNSPATPPTGFALPSIRPNSDWRAFFPRIIDLPPSDYSDVTDIPPAWVIAAKGGA